MYKQSIQNIKVAIIPLDGIILDLNRYRYNYYHHLCEQKKIPFSRKDFYPHLSNMYDMYKDLPLSHTMDIGPFNAKVERELYQYLSHKGVSAKEGCLELIEYFHQKEISVAVISTHRTKDAVNYLKLTHLFNQVQYIIGSDSISSPLPSPQILEIATKHFEVDYENVLVVSPFLSLNKAAYQLHMNIIYCEDLVPAQEEELKTSYKCVKDVFEVLNTVIFDQYEDVDIYSSILGMTSHMNKNELDQAKNKLEKVYQDDNQIIDIVNKTYAYHVSQLTQQNIKDASVFLNQKRPQRFHFDDEFNDEIDADEKINESRLQNKEKQTQEDIHFSHLPPEDENDLTNLLNQINKKDIKQKNVDNISIIPQQEKTIKERQYHIMSPFFNLIYTCIISFLIIFVGMIFYVAFIHQFNENRGIFQLINVIYYGYYSLIERIFKLIINGLHTFISVIPTYQNYVDHNLWFSPDGVVLFNIFIFQVVFIYIIKMIISISRSKNNDNTDI